MKRSVQFWRIVSKTSADLPGKFPADKLVDALDVANQGGLDRHYLCRSGMRILAHSGGSAPLPTVLLDKVRGENFPSVGNARGQRTRMPLNVGEGLLEPTYFSFLNNNVVAVLVGGHGPHAQRLSEYLQFKFSMPVSLVPVLRQDLDQVLDEMRLTQIELAIPAEQIDRNLIGGDWVEALDGASRLTHDGVIRIGLSVGRAGDAHYKQAFSRRLQELTDHLRQAAGIGALKTAKVSGVHQGNPQVVDLVNDKFVERVEVDADRFNDPDLALGYAREVLHSAVTENQEFLDRVTPTPGQENVTLGDFVSRTSRDDDS